MAAPQHTHSYHSVSLSPRSNVRYRLRSAENMDALRERAMAAPRSASPPSAGQGFMSESEMPPEVHQATRAMMAKYTDSLPDEKDPRAWWCDAASRCAAPQAAATTDCTAQGHGFARPDAGHQHRDGYGGDSA